MLQSDYHNVINITFLKVTPKSHIVLPGVLAVNL